MKANTDRKSSIIWNTKYSASQNYFPFPKINWWSYYRASSKQSFNSPSQSYWNTNNQITYYYIWQPIRNNKKINKRFLKTPNPQRAISIRPNFWNFQWRLKLHFLEVFFLKRGKPRELYLNSPAIISYRKFPFYLILSQNFQTLESTFLILEIHQFLDFPQPLAKKFRCRLPRTKGFTKFWFKGWKYGPKIYSIYVIIYHVLLV